MKFMKLIAAIGLLIAVTGAAQANIGLPQGPFVIHLNDWDMGTVYEFDANGDVSGYTPSPGAWNLGEDRLWAAGDDVDDLEDGWGVFIIDRITYGQFNAQGGIDTTNITYWSQDTSDKQLVGMFYGLQDLTVATAQDFNGNTALLTTSSGMELKVYEMDRPGVDGWQDYTMGSSGRTDLDSYSGIDETNLWLEAQGVSGHIDATATEVSGFTYLQNPALDGGVAIWLDVQDDDEVGNGAQIYDNGPNVPYVDSEMYPYFQTKHPDNGLDSFQDADLFLNMKTNVNNPTNDPNVGTAQHPDLNWTVISNDDVVGTAVVPEPMTMVAVGLAVAGLGGYIRKRRA